MHPGKQPFIKYGSVLFLWLHRRHGSTGEKQCLFAYLCPFLRTWFVLIFFSLQALFRIEHSQSISVMQESEEPWVEREKNVFYFPVLLIRRKYKQTNLRIHFLITPVITRKCFYFLIYHPSQLGIIQKYQKQ